ncbi:hypothetical protein BDV96DRAFT_640819 [Lophiotrema nucula]|uniref:Major facilitator superfamily domain-containing protein n=1 Tax=Lophiotrema nucula TaxID=690887 RepID=A0A6A5ZRE2_9PLEO|nr:hypothetical protein BDV96DRAFT_640819 [Lophiotrema nucula]
MPTESHSKERSRAGVLENSKSDGPLHTPPGIWEVDDNPFRPKNWSLPQKWTATLILSGFAFIQPLAETMLVPVEKQITQDLSITETYQWVLVNSLILIGMGFGPLLLAPISEIYGRRTALLGGGAVFFVWNTGCGFAQTLGQKLAFRLLYICSCCVSVYTIDAYTRYAASAISTNLGLRSSLAAFFPLFAPYMFDRVGFGWGATILAGCFTVIGFGAVVVLWFRGEDIRKRSKYCAANGVEQL